MFLRSESFRLSAIGGGRLFLAAAVTASLLAAALVQAGCGSSGGNGAGTSTGTSAADMVSRPAPGTVEMIDNLGDVTGDASSAPSFIDISRVSVSRDGGNYKFLMELASPLPSGPQAGAVVEFGFLLDSKKDGKPDWGIFTDLESQDGWLPGIYNEASKARLTGTQFPGTMSHDGTTLTMTVPAAAIGSPKSFKWFAYTQFVIKDSSSSQTHQAGDKIWDPAAPDNSKNWLPYP